MTLPENMDLILRRFEEPDEVREFPYGRFEIITIAGMTIGKATYEPGWKWSEHAGKALGKSYCEVEHLCLALSGKVTVAFEGEPVQVMTPGTLFYVSTKPHDSWVVGEESYVSIHFLGASEYTTR